MCQKESWSIHKIECRNLRRVAPRIIPDAARLLARLITILQNDGDAIRSYYTEGSFRMFKDLMSRKYDLIPATTDKPDYCLPNSRFP